MPPALRYTPSAHWDDRARCAKMPLEIFFGYEGHNLTPKEAKNAQRICWGCPVIRDCLINALTSYEPAGVQGGLTHLQRRKILRDSRGDVTAAIMAWDAQREGTPRAAGSRRNKDGAQDSATTRGRYAKAV